MKILKENKDGSELLLTSDRESFHVGSFGSPKIKGIPTSFGIDGFIKRDSFEKFKIFWIAIKMSGYWDIFPGVAADSETHAIDICKEIAGVHSNCDILPEAWATEWKDNGMTIFELRWFNDDGLPYL